VPLAERTTPGVAVTVIAITAGEPKLVRLSSDVLIESMLDEKASNCSRVGLAR
jgi:hypothetical protein